MSQPKFKYMEPDWDAIKPLIEQGYTGHFTHTYEFNNKVNGFVLFTYLEHKETGLPIYEAKMPSLHIVRYYFYENQEAVNGDKYAMYIERNMTEEEKEEADNFLRNLGVLKER